MKCIHCNHDAKYQDRLGHQCPSCRHPFAFEPRTGDPMTDGAFKAAIDAVGGQGRVRFLPAHLHHELSRRRARKKRSDSIGCGCAVVILSLLAVGVLYAKFEPTTLAPLGIAVVVALIAAVLVTRQGIARELVVSHDEFLALWDRWKQAHGSPPNLIVRKKTAHRPPAEGDLGDYSFDRAVICDRPETVDVLLANNFHFENNCAVLSIDGYPPHAFETVRRMLKRNPQLTVFALHDASAEGCTLAHRLSHDPAWFAGQGRVIDVGLRPRQAARFHHGFMAGEYVKVAAEVGITGDEAAWLATQTLPLEALPPEQLLKRLFRAITQASSLEESSSDADLGFLCDWDSFGSHADAGDGGGDDGFG